VRLTGGNDGLGEHGRAQPSRIAGSMGQKMKTRIKCLGERNRIRSGGWPVGGTRRSWTQDLPKKNQDVLYRHLTEKEALRAKKKKHLPSGLSQPQNYPCFSRYKLNIHPPYPERGDEAFHNRRLIRRQPTGVGAKTFGGERTSWVRR